MYLHHQILAKEENENNFLHMPVKLYVVGKISFFFFLKMKCFESQSCKEREGKTHTKSFHLLVCYSNGQHSQARAKSKVGARDSILVSMWVAVASSLANLYCFLRWS